jgi:hypothetical protein
MKRFIGKEHCTVQVWTFVICRTSRSQNVTRGKRLVSSSSFPLKIIAMKSKPKLEDIVSYLEKYIQIRNCASSSYRKMDIFREQMAKVGLHYGNCHVLLFMMTSILYMMSAMAQFVLICVRNPAIIVCVFHVMMCKHCRTPTCNWFPNILLTSD